MAGIFSEWFVSLQKWEMANWDLQPKATLTEVMKVLKILQLVPDHKASIIEDNP